MTGTVEARTVWKGVATKCPAASNHSVKDRESSMVRGLPPDLGVMLMARLYMGTFFLVCVAIVTCRRYRRQQPNQPRF